MIIVARRYKEKDQADKEVRESESDRETETERDGHADRQTTDMQAVRQ